MANVQGKFYRGETQRSGVTPTSPPNAVDEPVGPLNPPGSGSTTTYKQLGDTTDKSFIGKNGFVPVVVGENQLTLQPLPNADKDGLLDPGIVQWTGTDYDFNVSAALARFQGVFPLNSDPDILTLTTPDATNDRIDLFILQILFDGDGIPNGMEADFITGTPAGSPIKPQINPSTQIELTSVLVTAGSTTPTLTEEVVYDENTEWAGSTAGTGTCVFNSAVDPYQGSVSVETTNIQNGFQVQFNNGSEIDISTYQTFGFQINLKASLGANQNLYVTFLDGSLAPVSNFVLINLNKSLTGYQFIGIALNAVTFTSFDVQYIRFSFVRTSGPATYSGYFLDIVKLEGGIAPPVTQNTFLNLTDTPSSYIGQASKVVSVKADETGLEFTTASGGGISGSGTTNEIAYFTGATAIASLSTATYPSLTELSYVKGVTSALQTQINSAGSKWTSITEGIYRDGRVLVGGTTFKDAGGGSGTDFVTFQVKSKVSGTGGNVIFSDFTKSGGESVLELRQSATPVGLINYSANEAVTIGNITSFSGGRGLVIRPNSTGSSIICTDTAGTTEMFGVSNTGITRTIYLHTNGGTNSWGSVIRGLGNNVSSRMSLIVQRSTGTVDFQVASNGEVTLFDGGNFNFGTTTGTKIGLTTSQKLAFWNKTPIIQPTTGITGATLVGGGGTTITDTDTFGGYTLQKIAAALINVGILA